MVHKIEVTWVGCMPVCGCGHALTMTDNGKTIIFRHVSQKLSVPRATVTV